MGRNNTKAVKNIAKMYEQLGLAQDDIFHKTKLLLSIYRDVVWATLSDCNCVNEEIYYYGDDLTDALVYLEEFAPDIERSEFERRVCNLFKNKWMIDLIDKAMSKVYDYYNNGRLYHEILSKSYLTAFRYTESELLEILNLVFYVMANTGMRVGEITGLRWSDIDLKKGIIRVNHTLVYYNHRDEKGCYFSINTPKTKAGEREIPMTEGVKQAFLMEREFQSQAEISSKSRVDGYDDFIFVNRYGDVQNQGNLNKALRRMMRDCNDEILEKYGAVHPSHAESEEKTNGCCHLRRGRRMSLLSCLCRVPGIVSVLEKGLFVPWANQVTYR